METQMLGASDKITALEYQLFTEVRLKVAENVHRIQKTAFVLAKLDVYRSLAAATDIADRKLHMAMR